MIEKQCGRNIGLLLIVALIAMPVMPVMAMGSGTELSDQADSAVSIALFSPQENIEGFDQDSQSRCAVPEILTEVKGLSIDPALVNASPYWIYLAAGKKEQRALIDFIRKSDTLSRKKTEWIQFLQVTWKKYPLKFERQGSSAALGPLKPIREYTFTRKEAATFAEIDKMIAADMANTAGKEVGVRWYHDQHKAFMETALSGENYIPPNLKPIAIDNAPTPDDWYPWDPTGVLARSMNHGYLITQYTPTVEGLGFAPQNTGTYALSAKAKYLMHDYNGAFADLGYSSHFITDLGQPYHSPNAILGIWPNYDDPFSADSKIVRYKTLHDQYEGFVSTYWTQPLPNGRTLSNYANSATGATIIVDPTTSAKYHAVASNAASVPLYYLCSWHYLFNRNYEFQKNPAIVTLTGERIVATTENTRGLIRFVTGQQIPTLTITASAGEHGSISPPGSVSVNYGDSLSFTITPESGYTIDQILVDNSPVTQNPYTFDNVVSDHTISATFRPIPSDNPVKLTDHIWTPNGIPTPVNTWAHISTTAVTWSGTGSVRLVNHNSQPYQHICADEIVRVTTDVGQLTYGEGGYDWCGYPDITSIMQPGSNTITLDTKNMQYASTGIYETWMVVVPGSKSTADQQMQYVQILDFSNKTISTGNPARSQV